MYIYFTFQGLIVRDMEEIYPSWLNKDFIKSTLKSAGDSSVEVVSYNVTKATAVGDNYLSDMFRVTAHVTRGSGSEVTSMIVKCSRELESVDAVSEHDNERM
jgi:hypothetical protein